MKWASRTRHSIPSESSLFQLFTLACRLSGNVAGTFTIYPSTLILISCCILRAILHEEDEADSLLQVSLVSRCYIAAKIDSYADKKGRYQGKGGGCPITGLHPLVRTGFYVALAHQCPHLHLARDRTTDNLPFFFFLVRSSICHYVLFPLSLLHIF